jgi:DNA-binding NtrC family response regulator
MDSFTGDGARDDRAELGVSKEEETTDLRALVRRYEAQLIIAALDATRGNQTRAAGRLKIPLRTLAYKIKMLGIKRLGYRAE